MTEKRRHVEVTPNFVLHREVADAPDSGEGIAGDDYVNFDGFEDGIVDVVPSASANPDVSIATWSDEANKFVKDNPAQSATGLSAGLGYQFRFKALGRKVRVVVGGTVAAGDTVKLLVAGFNQRKA